MSILYVMIMMISSSHEGGRHEQHEFSEIRPPLATIIRFRYTGQSTEAVLEKLPTAQIISSDSEGWNISAEVFGKGIEMWLRSQGKYVDCIERI